VHRDKDPKILIPINSVSQPFIKPDILDEARIGVETNTAFAEIPGETLGVRNQRSAEPLALKARRDGNVYDQQLTVFFYRWFRLRRQGRPH
jgi:hypothetical protein